MELVTKGLAAEQEVGGVGPVLSIRRPFLQRLAIHCMVPIFKKQTNN